MYEPLQDKTNNMACVLHEDLDQPGHPPQKSLCPKVTRHFVGFVILGLYNYVLNLNSAEYTCSLQMGLLS